MYLLDPESGEPITLFPDQELDLDLDLRGYRLIPGVRGEGGLPISAFLRLFAVRDEEIRQIRQPADLSSIVTRVDDEGQAWQFLRLFTSPATHALFGLNPAVIDLTLNADVDGGISEEAARTIRMLPPDMTSDRDGYRLRRDLVIADVADRRGRPSAVRRTERLGSDGTYEVVDEKPLGRIEPTSVRLPSHE